jgi:ABC-type dipeptide/oligopeptide/nickel transport system ATPase subunit
MAEEELQQENVNHDWASTVTTIGLSATGGFVIGGVPGALIGAGLASADEFLMSNYNVDKHYLTTSAFWGSALAKSAALLSLIPYASKVNSLPLIAAAAPAISYLTDDFLNVKEKINIPLESFVTLNQLFDEKGIISKAEAVKIYNQMLEDPYGAFETIKNDCYEALNNPFLMNFLTISGINIFNIGASNYLLNRLGTYNNGLYINNLLTYSSQGATATTTLLDNGKVMLLFLGGKQIIDFFTSIKINSLYNEQFELVTEKITKLILTGSNGHKLAASEEGKTILNKVNMDSYFLIFEGADKLNTFIKDSSKAVVSLNNIMKLAPDTFAPYAISLIPYEIFLNHLAEETKIVSDNLTLAEIYMWELKSHINKNIQQISVRDGSEFTQNKLFKALNEKNDLTKQKDFLAKMKNGAYEADVTLNNIIDVFVLGSKFLNNEIALNKIPVVKNSINDLYTFLSSNLEFELQNQVLLQSRERMNRLFEIISTKDESNITRIHNEEGKIIFENFSINLDEKNIVTIDYLEFEPGKNYAITGRSGCGKTSTLTATKEDVLGDLHVNGTVSTPLINGKPVKIMFIDQKVYLPFKSTLLETIYFPNTLPTDLTEYEKVRSFIIELMKELEIDQFINDPGNEKGLLSRLDKTDFKLSGGQEKKVAIIQAIQNKPDILIMDETFTGLDKHSLYLVLKALDKYLSGMKLSIDHNAPENNFIVSPEATHGFYFEERHFANGTVTIMDIEGRIYDHASSNETTSGEVVNESHMTYANLSSVLHSFYESWHCPVGNV